MPRKVIPYNPKLKTRARELRRRMTKAEIRLWKAIKGKQLEGYDFDRQRPIDEYIVDFYCKELNLAIEVDGMTHDFKEEKDRKRQKRLELLGVRFVRFWDSEVKNDLTGCLDKLRAWIREHAAEPTPRSPDGERTPPERG